MRAREQRLRGDAYLERVYKERLEEKLRNGEVEDDDSDNDMEGDPIEDVLEDSKGSYLGLIHTFLWMEQDEATQSPAIEEAVPAGEQGESSSMAEEIVIDKASGPSKDIPSPA